ncbi:MAG: glycosyltransferase family 2 protein [Parcubacteria group bacterium]|nr:glycosyltransferase family 2 protein [Parcubacteria group bacterium]
MILDPIRQYRLLEMLPGVAVWTTFIGFFVLSFAKPVWVIAFVLAFAIYWFLRVLYFIVFIVIGWRRYREAITTDWTSLLKALPGHDDIYHLIVLPTYNEPFEVVETSFESYKNSEVDLKKVIIVFSGEARAEENFKRVSAKIRERYEGVFGHLEITMHPDGIPGEMKGKGANAHWAGHAAKEVVDKMGLNYKQVIASYFDVDTVVHRQYFAALSHRYLTHPNPTRTAYQPVVLYNNNIWQSSLVTRVAAFGTTFWLMTDLARPDRLFTFSSHAMSLQALVDVGFWQRDIVTDDSRIFLQCFIHYCGDFTVTPLYVPLSMDTVQAATYWRSFKNLYKQQRRWAYGSEHLPYMLWHFFKRDHGIPLGKKLKYVWNLGEGMYSWATTPIILMVLGRLPFWAASGDVRDLAFVQTSPHVLQWLLTLSMVGIMFSALFSLLLLPPRPKNQPRYKILVMFLQWLFLPITLFIWGAIPATEAQTRLMLGKYLGFWVTEKVRK